jgi:hypothetical protein
MKMNKIYDTSGFLKNKAGYCPVHRVKDVPPSNISNVFLALLYMANCKVSKCTTLSNTTGSTGTLNTPTFTPNLYSMHICSSGID